MIPISKIEPPEWVRAAPVRAVMAALEGEGEDPKALFVGGCVRNHLLDEPVGDIDIATRFTPDDVTERLKRAGLKAVPTGIDHGTITAVADGQGFEITTLRKDVETDGRRAVVAFTQDWAEDAARRDFTMNTLLAAPDGRVFDPLGCGLEDLKARRVVFAGDPATRIAEDYLRILRFFRFYAHYGAGDIDQDGLQACADVAAKVGSLSKERITQEFLKILAAEKATSVLAIMFESGVLADLPAADFDIDILTRLEGNNVLSKLFVLGGLVTQDFDQYLILSNAQKRDLKILGEAFESLSGLSEKAIKKLIYYYKNDVAKQVYLLRCARDKAKPDPEFLEIFTNWQAPEFPITGQDLITKGASEGPALGQKLKELEDKWLEETL